MSFKILIEHQLKEGPYKKYRLIAKGTNDGSGGYKSNYEFEAFSGYDAMNNPIWLPIESTDSLVLSTIGQFLLDSMIGEKGV